ncbi:hypothetical protein LIA77_09598 [Sarocladium implicatum]|nr:hypothetical protein LIA77_09598 [Sarocladium implicatum]
MPGKAPDAVRCRGSWPWPAMTFPCLVFRKTYLVGVSKTNSRARMPGPIRPASGQESLLVQLPTHPPYPLLLRRCVAKTSGQAFGSSLQIMSAIIELASRSASKIVCRPAWVLVSAQVPGSCVILRAGRTSGRVWKIVRSVGRRSSLLVGQETTLREPG